MTIYYEAEWLVFGGPPPGINSPTPLVIDDVNAGSMLSIIRKTDDSGWLITAGDGNIGEQWVVAESPSPQDIMAYFREYLHQYEQWQIQEQIAEAEYEQEKYAVRRAESGYAE